MFTGLLPALLAAAVPDARAAELHLTLKTPEGIDATDSWTATETFRKKYGPVDVGKASTVYSVTIPAAVYDPLEDAYRIELSVCLEWSRKGENDQFCKKEDVLAPIDAARTFAYAVKGKEKFEWTVGVWFTGERPSPPGLPAPEPEPEPEE